MDRADFVYITGDAYVDHPSFGLAIISRLLESEGATAYACCLSRTGGNRRASAIFGEPRLGFLVSAGNMDSMVNHYTVSKNTEQRRLRSGGAMGLRDRAAIVYGNLIRRTYKHTPVILADRGQSAPSFPL